METNVLSCYNMHKQYLFATLLSWLSHNILIYRMIWNVWNITNQRQENETLYIDDSQIVSKYMLVKDIGWQMRTTVSKK